MATRENQTLQIALMVFCVITVLLAILAYFFYDGMSKNAARAEDLNNQLQTRDQNARQMQVESESLKEYIGLNPQDSAETASQAFEDDMKTYGATFAEEDRTYRNLIETVSEENRRKTESEITAKQKISQMEGTIVQIEAEKDKQIQKFEQQLQTVSTQAAKDREQFNKDRDAFKQKTEQLETQITELQQKFDATVAAKDEQVAALTNDLAAANKQVAECKAMIQTGEPGSEVPDGLITQSDLRRDMVWVNLGSADGLVAQTAFSVYDASQPVGGDDNPPKGSIEITQVYEDRSVGRITSDDASNPILRDDKIYSPIWQKGRTMRFALSGWIDLDNDGNSDIERIKSLIALNGGQVDAYVDNEGELQDLDKLTVNTRYIVNGDLVSGVLDEFSTARRKATETIRERAIRFQVDPIGIEQFLDLMGWNQASRTVPLGGQTRGEDFISKKPESSRFTPGPFRRRVSRQTPY